MKKLSIKTKVIISLLTILINLYCLFIFENNYNSIYHPTESKINLTGLLSKRKLSESDYSLLLRQTGLGRPAVDDLLTDDNGKDKILSFQKNYYTRNRMYTEKLNPFTSQETLLLKSQDEIGNNLLAPLKNGDILLTKSTQTLFWRHGHCGIVVDAARGITLESLEPGTISMNQDINKWIYYPTLKVLRLKNADSRVLDQLAQFSGKNLIGKKYNILASKYYKKRIPTSENCSQLIWQAFYNFGYDIDSNKGIIVTPEDIAKSPLLEIVQIKGFNPDKAW